MVTFLLTDIAGSSVLWDRHTASMGQAVDAHERLIEEAVRQNAGHTLKRKGEGDSTFSVFDRATDAVRAAAQISRKFREAEWPDGVVVSIRIALASGEAEERDGDYFGPTVNRAARIRSMALPGQTLLGEACARLVLDSLPPGFEVIELGERDVPGHRRPEVVFELVELDAGQTGGYRVLGPLEVHVGGQAVNLTSKQRLLLAVLLVRSGELVAGDQLAEELWGNQPPADPGAALRSQIARLRSRLGALGGDLTTHERGYRLQLRRARLDATRFEDLVAESHRFPPTQAVGLLEEALALRRGPPLGEFADREFARAEAVRLGELVDAARERRAELLLACGRPDEAVIGLEPLLEEHPERERARALLMEALYRSGRQTDALALYQAWRRRLGEDLGVEPSPMLQQLEVAILRHDVPARRQPSRPGRPSSLPVPVTSFLGRDAEVPELIAALTSCRLVTVCGPGGVGKTRIALEAARACADRYAEGARFCDLSVVRRPTGVVRSMATAVGLEERAFSRLEDQLVEHLAQRQILLVLDNCEHVLEAARRVCERLLRSTDSVTVVATSRERLGVDGERVWALAPLDCHGRDAPAVRLFVERARAVDATAVPDDELDAVTEVCRTLDGLPLAVELAAARLSGLMVHELAESLRGGLGLLAAARRAGDRHGSLEAVVDWSYRQLPVADRRVFRWLSVFAGYFDADAAAAVAGAGAPGIDVLRAILGLVDRSLVNARRERSSTRYWLLETLRTYGIDRLREEGELQAARDAHAAWAVELAHRAAAGLQGADEAAWARAVDQCIDELRAAHGWLAGRDPERSLQLVVSLHWYAIWRIQSEVFRWAETAASAASGQRSSLLAEALGSASFGAAFRGDLASAERLARAGLDAAGDLDPRARRRPLQALGEVALLRGDADAAIRLYLEAHDESRSAGDLVDATWDLAAVALARVYSGRPEEARDMATRVLTTANASGAPSAMAFAHYVLGELAASSQHDEAVEHLLDAVARAGGVGCRLVVNLAQVTLASLRAREQDASAALRSFEEVIVEWDKAGSWTSQWVTLRNLVELLERLGASWEAAVLHGAATTPSSGAPPFGPDAERLAAAADRLRRSLGQPAFVEASRTGAGFEDKQVVDFALDAVRRLLDDGTWSPSSEVP